ncbi:MAG: threonine/serine exporter family protein [Carboxydocellales bacterium]
MKEIIDEIQDLVILAGEILLKNGAETYRVEDTVERIGFAAGMCQVEAFATPTVIIVTLVEPGGVSQTKVRRIRDRGISLNKVAAVNEVSRRMARGELSVAQANTMLMDVQRSPNAYPFWVHLVAAGVGSGCFTFLFGGNLREIFLAVIAGLVIHWLRLQATNWGFNRLFGSFLGGLAAAAIGIFGQTLLQEVNADKVIIGAIMTLVPGLAITHAVRDVIYEDLLSGVSRGVEAILVSVAVAAGVSLALGFWLGVG